MPSFYMCDHSSPKKYICVTCIMNPLQSTATGHKVVFNPEDTLPNYAWRPMQVKGSLRNIRKYYIQRTLSERGNMEEHRLELRLDLGKIV